MYATFSFPIPRPIHGSGLGITPGTRRGIEVCMQTLPEGFFWPVKGSAFVACSTMGPVPTLHHLLLRHLGLSKQCTSPPLVHCLILNTPAHPTQAMAVGFYAACFPECIPCVKSSGPGTFRTLGDERSKGAECHFRDAFISTFVGLHFRVRPADLLLLAFFFCF